LADPQTLRLPARLAGLLDYGRRSATVLQLSATLAQLPADWPLVFTRASNSLGSVQPLDLWTRQPVMALQADPAHCRQGFWSDLVYSQRSKMLQGAWSGQDAVRFACQRTPHAMAWAAATPAASLGTLVPSSDFRCLLRFHLGMTLPAPAMDPEVSSPATPCCPRCSVTMDVSGHHLVCCHKNGIVQRHGAVQEALYRLLSRAGFTVRKEQATPERSRPGDVFVSRLDANGPAAVDITVRHPLAPSRVLPATFDVDRWRAQQEADKVRKYHAQCSRLGWSLVPFVADCYGGLGTEARTLVSTCLKQIAAQQEVGFRRGAEAEVWQGLLLPLAKEVGRQLRGSLFCRDREEGVDLPWSTHTPYALS